ncbi:MAG: pyridoxamine 5'-phosphate oxidase family protein [Tepidiformaceae bacterium]
MATWAEFREGDPTLAAAGERLLQPNGDGTAFLATVRGDGGPRVHPVMPVLAGGCLHVFIVNLSPKHADLLVDGRYALHALPPAAGGEEFYVTGDARFIESTSQRAEVVAASGGRLGLHEFESLFELDIQHVLYTVWANWGTAETWPEYRKWHSRD